MLLDDDETVLRRAGEWLRQTGFDVTVFAQPDDAIRFVQQASVQVAMVDLHMDPAGQADTIHTLHAASPHTRIIAMAAFPRVAHIIAAIRAGARDVLEKPIQQPSLAEAVDRQLLDAGVAVRGEHDFNQRLGTRIRTLRTRADRTLANVADNCGLTAAQLSQIELGKSATTTWSLARIAAALGLPPHEMLRDL